MRKLPREREEFESDHVYVIWYHDYYNKRKRRELWDGDIYGEDQAVSVIKKQYIKHTGKWPMSIYERLTAKDR